MHRQRPNTLEQGEILVQLQLLPPFIVPFSKESELP